MRSLALVFLFLLQLISGNVAGQLDPYEPLPYSFLCETCDTLQVYDQEEFDTFFSRLDTLLLKGDGKLKVLHIGDSHIQADFFSGRMRQLMQTSFQGTNGGRGFLYPYKLAKTNNPYNYKVSYTGEWESCRNVERNKSCNLGLAGITSFSYDTLATFSIILRYYEPPVYDFIRLSVIHSFDTLSFEPESNGYYLKEQHFLNDSVGVTTFFWHEPSDSVTIFFSRTDTLQKYFQLYGLYFENDDPGIEYSSVGVNGADVESFLRCNQFSGQLKYLDPDFIIVSLGTNDCYIKLFDTLAFEQSLHQFVDTLKMSCPGIPILLTTPADHYYYRRYPNKNVAVTSNIMIKEARNSKCAVWDLYSTMGGYNSMLDWYRSGLTAKDKLHFSKQGYYLQGELLFRAFLHQYDKYIEKHYPPNE